MAYQSRKRNYKTRRERLDLHQRNIRLILIFAAIAAVVLIYKNRRDIWFYIETSFS